MMSTRTFERPGGVLFFAAGCVVATLLFLTAVAMAGHLLERVLDDRLALWLNRAVGLFLIGFALKLTADLLLGA
jgi:arginine exporter protein ArgO